MRNQNKRSFGTAIAPWSGYADDLVLFLRSQNGLQNATLLLDHTFKDFGLAINETKTETMILNHTSHAQYPESIVKLRSTQLKNVKNFAYLGVQLNYEQCSTGDEEINQRIQMAIAKFAQMSNLLQNFHLNLRLRVLFLNSFVRSRLTYACQNWNLTTIQYERLDVTYRTFLRRMVRRGFQHVDEKNNDYRYVITNDVLHRICGTRDVNCFVKDQQKNYVAHVIRMPTSRGVKLLTFNDDHYVKKGRSAPTLLEQSARNMNMTVERFCSCAFTKTLGN